jgi:hypothetical protein
MLDDVDINLSLPNLKYHYWDEDEIKFHHKSLGFKMESECQDTVKRVAFLGPSRPATVISKIAEKS